MKRRSFLKGLFQAAAVVALAPQLAFRAPKVVIKAPQLTAFWLETTRYSRCVDEEYEKAVGRYLALQPEPFQDGFMRLPI